MMVRLGFAVAAHLDPEILVVDEVLAVGDAEFQKKAIGKMQDVSRGEGRTVLFVSHNMASIRSLCKSGVVLDRGQLVYEGTTLDAISYYKRNSYMENVGHKIIDYARYQLSSIELKKVTINGGEDSCVSLDAGENKLLLRIEGVNKVARFIAVEVRIIDENEIPLAMFMPDMVDELPFFEEGNFIIEKELNFPFGVVAGTYYLSISLIHPQVQGFVDLDHSVKVELGGTTVNAGLKYSYTHGMGWLQIY